MLVYLRKHQKTVMLFVAVIVIIAFTFFYDAGRGPDREKNSKLFSIDGKDYTLKDYEKILSKLSMVYQLRSMDYFNFANQITSVRTDKEQRGMAQAFAYNLTILRNRSKSLLRKLLSSPLRRSLLWPGSRSPLMFSLFRPLFPGSGFAQSLGSWITM